MLNAGPVARLLPHLGLFVAAAILGSSFVAVRAIMADQDQPAVLGLLRYGLAGLLLLPLAIGWHRPGARLPRFTRREWGLILVLGILQFGLFHLFVNSALQFIPASRGAVIFALIPVMTMFAAALFGRDSLSAVQIGAALLGFFGVALAMGEKALAPALPAADGAGDLGAGWLGEALFFLAVCCGALYNALSARLLRVRSIMPVTALTMILGSAVLFPMALAEGLFDPGPAFDSTDWWIFAYLVGPGGLLGFLLFNWGLRRTSPNRAAIYVPLAPIASAFFGWLLLDEPLGGLFLLGLACAVAAPLLIALERRRRAAKLQTEIG
ncbi:MAG: DMT family transporter [Sneathiellaceae bacterium]